MSQLRKLAVYLAILSTTLLAGCEESPRRLKNLEDTGYKLISVFCIKGVAYYHGPKTLAPAYNQDGSLILCKEKP